MIRSYESLDRNNAAKAVEDVKEKKKQEEAQKKKNHKITFETEIKKVIISFEVLCESQWYTWNGKYDSELFVCFI